jgi:3-oxoacyl-[acyl-carrier-protein] synthase III
MCLTTYPIVCERVEMHMKLEHNGIVKHAHGLRPKVRVESFGVSGDYTGRGATGIDSAKRAIDHCFSRSGYRRDDVDIVIFCGVYRAGFVFEPAIAAMLAREAGIVHGTAAARRKPIFAFDIFNGATGFLSACGVAAQMISSGKARTALVVASESEGDLKDESAKLRGIAETASAALLDKSSSEGPGFESFMFRNFLRYQHYFSSRLWVQPGRTEIRYQSNGDISAAYLQAISETLPEFVARERFDLSKVSYILGPQLGNEFSLKLSKLLNVGPENFVDVGRENADLYTSSFSYALQYLEENRLTKAGDLALTLSVGPGVQVGCATYRF